MQYDFNLPPGGALNLDVKGKFFKYRSGTGAIRVRASKGGYVDLLPGQGVRGFDFESLTVADRSGANNVGVLIVGDFDFQDDRIAGTVDVVDGGKARTLSNIAGISGLNCGASAGVYSWAQLWNPVGSAKNMIISGLQVSSSGAGGIVIRSTNAPFATLAGNPVSKLNQNIITAIEVRTATGAAWPGQGISTILVSAGTNVPVSLKEPIVMQPGFGLAISGGSLNQDVSGIVEFWCEPQQ
ncbi:hypothetical protein, partial [Janthinobacterium sp. LB2P10]|uniref:hypothetical protein n=1 Tax=Janthinobacterium sp. LB2P10 TaxID=3424194 RepID=UPI003F22453A